MQTFGRIRRSLAAVLLVLYLPGCYHYAVPKGMSPQEYIAAEHPKQVRLTLADGSRRTLHQPWVSADSIGGRPVVRSQGGSLKLGPPWAIALSDVRRMEGRKLDALSTATAGVLSVLLIGCVALAIGQSNAGF